MTVFLQPPKKMPVLIRLGSWIANKVTGVDLLPPRLLAWYPKAAISSGIMEALVAHEEGRLSARLLKLVRIQVSVSVSCPFCVDMNSYRHREYGITDLEMEALHLLLSLEEVESFNALERLALEYTRAITGTPAVIPTELAGRLKETFSERELVILATTAAQVNYWARVLGALGVPPAGFMDQDRG